MKMVPFEAQLAEALEDAGDAEEVVGVRRQVQEPLLPPVRSRYLACRSSRHQRGVCECVSE